VSGRGEASASTLRIWDSAGISIFTLISGRATDDQQMANDVGQMLSGAVTITLAILSEKYIGAVR
jgi:hypothetical protein